MTMTALLTDPEVATFRSCYNNGVTEVTIVAYNIHYFEWKHGTVCYQIDLSEKQIKALTEYTGGLSEIKQGTRYTYAVITLSGDRKKDGKFIRNMRHMGENIVNRIGFEMQTDFAPNLTFVEARTGIILENWESILLFLSAVAALIAAATLFSKRRKILYGNTYAQNKKSSIPSKKMFLLQDLCLIVVIFIVAVSFAYIGILLLNARACAPFIVPEPISAVSALALGIVSVFPFTIPKKRIYKSSCDQAT